MKTLTYNQRRWALASVVMLALTATAAYQSPAPIAGSRDLASESSDSDVVSTRVATDKGVVKVKYIKNGKKVTAIVPQTEGNATCDYCGTYSLDVDFEKNKSNLENFNVALLQTLNKAKSAAKLEEAEEQEVAVKPKKEVAEEGGVVRGEDSGLFADIEAKCDKKGASEKASCAASALAKKLSKNSKYDQKEVIEFYQEFIKGSLAEMISNSQATVKELSYNRKQYSQEEMYLLGQDRYALQMEKEEFVSNVEQARSEIEDARKSMAESLKDLVKASGKSYPQLRAEITKSVTEYLQKSALQVRELRVMALNDLSSNNSTGFVQKSLEADNMRNDLAKWSDQSVGNIYMGLEYLKDKKEINSNDYNVYQEYIKNFNSNMQKILATPSYGPNNTASLPDLSLVNLGGSNVNTQVQREGLTTINGKVVQLSPELLTRIKAEVGQANQQQTTQLGAQPVSQQAPSAISTLSSPATTTSDSFFTNGPAKPATAAELKERQEIRAKFGPQIKK